MGWIPSGDDPPPHDDPPSKPPADSPPSSSPSSSGGEHTDPRIAQNESLFRSAYIALWGEAPTEGYISNAAKQGMNSTEFVHRERMKEAFKDTKAYQDEFKQLLSAFRGMGAF